MSKRRIAFCVVAVAALLAVAGAMFVIGRGHTVYFDNVTAEYGGMEYKAPHRIEVYVDGERVAKLAARERGMVTTIGQGFDMTINVTQEKDGETLSYQVHLNLPYSMDGLIVNLPMLLAGQPQEAWLSEFIQTVVEEEEEEEVPGGGEDDGLGIGGEEGLEMSDEFEV